MNVKDISAGVYNKDSEHRAVVAQAAAWFAASELARYYEQMIEDLESCADLELAE